MTADPQQTHVGSSFLRPSAPFAALQNGVYPARGVVISGRDGLGLATVLVKRGQTTVLRQRVSERFAIELPAGSYRSAAGGIAFAGTGPGAWLATAENGGNAFSVALREQLGGAASISDQSDGYAVLRLTGPKVRDVLEKLMPVDVHPHAFKVGQVAATVSGYIGVTLWRLEDAADGALIFEIALYRSFAESFWHALSGGAAEFG